MTTKKISGDIGVYTFKSWSKIVNSGAHPPILKLITFKANQGLLPAGLLVALDADGLGVPYNPDASDETLTPETLTGTINGTVSGTCTIDQDPDPDLTGTISGTATGSCSVDLPSAVVPAPEKTPRYILLEDLDTMNLAGENCVGLCLIHGVAVGANCLVGVIEGTAPDNNDKSLLEPNIILE